MKNLFTLIGIVVLMSVGSQAYAQKTYADVYTIMHSSCSSDDCHGNDADNQSFNVDSPSAVLYGMLINGRPTNPYADTVADFRLIVPGDARRSFVLRKLARCVNGSLEMADEEGNDMPDDDPNRIPVEELELIYQWIVQGASQTAVISPDTVAGDVCDIFLSLGPLPSHGMGFSVSPNPATEAFSVSYTLEKPSQVAIEVFDSKGVKATVLNSSLKAVGTHREAFDTNLPEGVYFVRLSVDGKQFLKKLVVL